MAAGGRRRGHLGPGPAVKGRRGNGTRPPSQDRQRKRWRIGGQEGGPVASGYKGGRAKGGSFSRVESRKVGGGGGERGRGGEDCAEGERCRGGGRNDREEEGGRRRGV